MFFGLHAANKRHVILKAAEPFKTTGKRRAIFLITKIFDIGSYRI
jgi:hypothetical protein